VSGQSLRTAILAALVVIGAAACVNIDTTNTDRTVGQGSASTTSPAEKGNMTYPVRTLTVDIASPVETVAAFLAEPLNFSKWAKGLGANLAPGEPGSGAEPGEWIADTPRGKVFVRFSPRNDFGVADHWVRIPDGTVVANPIRAMRNAEGTTVAFTLFRRPGVGDAEFASDAEAVQRDLAALKTALEHR
jgi:hypothetical protein